MKEWYREGIADHSGPEPCEGSRKAALEALDRGICRLGMELRKMRCRKPTVSGSHARVREAAKKEKKLRFTALLHHVNIDLLRDGYRSLKKQAAPGADNMTWKGFRCVGELSQ